ncbi:MAG: DnaJ family domain-containing protein [Anaerolineae bacterium]
MQDNRKIEENNAWDHLSKWETLIEKRIQELIGDGDMSWHPKAGQPFEFEDESTVPDEMRIAHKMMKDHDTVPAWMSLGFTLRDRHKKIHRRVRQYALDYVRRRQKALDVGSFILHREADERWQKATRQLRIDIANYNNELLNYNLQVPPQVGQMVPIDPDTLIQTALIQAEDA